MRKRLMIDGQQMAYSLVPGAGHLRYFLVPGRFYQERV